jgi:hypothetical protein
MFVIPETTSNSHGLKPLRMRYPGYLLRFIGAFSLLCFTYSNRRIGLMVYASGLSALHLIYSRRSQDRFRQVDIWQNIETRLDNLGS